MVKIQGRFQGIYNQLVIRGLLKVTGTTLAVWRWMITDSTVQTEPLAQDIFPYSPDPIGYMSGWCQAES